MASVRGSFNQDYYFIVVVFGNDINIRGGVEDNLQGKDLKKIRGQGPTFRGQTLSRPRTEMLEAKAKDQEHNFSKLW